MPQSFLWHRPQAVAGRSLLLVAGTALAIAWANLHFETYGRLTHSLRFLVNDVGMVFFFALAAKEVFESTLPGGALASLRRAAMPLLAAAGGMAVPAGLYALFVAGLGPSTLDRGWAIPCATDIAFSSLVARFIFPRDHPAIPFLLLLAIADDALGLVILALFYPTGDVSVWRLTSMMSVALALAWWLRHRRVLSFWPYVLGPGTLSWIGLFWGGFHPALALVPVIPFMPHAARDLGISDPREAALSDTLNTFEHWWKLPVEGFLFLFGLVNAGVPFTSVGPGTWYVLIALVLGKPTGILLFTALGEATGIGTLQALRYRDILALGTAAGIGFTVSLFFATAAFPDGPMLDQTKMGALFSFVAAPLAVVLARWLRPAPPRQLASTA